MASGDSPVGDPIPELTDRQSRALKEYLDRHRRLRDKLAPHPMLIARVLADDKRGASVKPVTGVVPDGYADHDEYLPDLFERMGLSVTRMDGTDAFFVSRTAWRLGFLPDETSLSDAYHRRCGVFFGYPPDAIEYFINSDGVAVTHCDIARSGVIPAEDIAYLVFVSYTHEQSLDQFDQMITLGKRLRARITELSAAWDLPGLDAHAEDVYQDYVAAFSGDGGTWNPPMTIHPDVVTEDDVRPLLS